MNNLMKDLKKLLTFRNILLLSVFLVVSLVWFRYIARLVLLAVFIPLTFTTIRYSKMVPHISIESNTSITFFIGYAFGPIYALIYGPFVGVSCYLANSFISPGYMMTPVIAGFTGMLVGYMHQIMGMGFFQAFFIGLVIRTIIAFPLFMMFYDPLEVFTHQTSQFFSNLVIYFPLLSALLSLVGAFV